MSAPPPPTYQQATGPQGGYSAFGQPPQQYPSTAYAPLPTTAEGYPPQQGGYPPQQAGYPPQPAGYPPQQAGYPPQPAGYPPQQEGYPPKQDGYPGYPGGVQTTANMTGDAENPQTEVRSGERPWDDDTAFAGQSFSDKAIRRMFIRKVYLILLAQLLVTCAFIAFFLLYEPAKHWVWRNSWFYYCSYATFFVTYIALVCCPGVRRKWPANIICLCIFTLAFSYMTGTISSFYDSEIVLIAAGITAAVCLAISLFAIQTKIDFTMCTGLLFALCMVVFFFGVACVIVTFTIGHNYILHCVYGALAALLFSLFLAYDTQMLVGGRKHELSPEEYIFGALQLYLDIVYIFLIILSFFGGKGD